MINKHHKYTFICPICNAVIEHVQIYDRYDRYEQLEGWKVFNGQVTSHLIDHDGVIITLFNQEEKSE